MDLILRLDSVIRSLSRQRQCDRRVRSRSVSRVRRLVERFGKAGQLSMSCRIWTCKVASSSCGGHPGFSVSHTPIDVGKTTTVVGLNG